MFKPGDVVVCVDDRNASVIRRGGHYRIKGVFTGRHFLDGHRGLGICLFGVAPITPGVRGYDACRFRKIDDEVTEDFREMLRKLPVRLRGMTPDTSPTEPDWADALAAVVLDPLLDEMMESLARYRRELEAACERYSHGN